jgi:predicted RNase H-like nuclease (RuvC/YqgF family)
MDSHNDEQKRIRQLTEENRQLADQLQQQAARIQELEAELQRLQKLLAGKADSKTASKPTSRPPMARRKSF